MYVAGERLCDVPPVDDAWAEDLLSVVRNRDMPEQARLRATIPLGPVLAAANAEGFDDGQAPVTEAVFDCIHSVLYDVYADTSTPATLRRRALEAFAHAPERRLEDAIRAAYGSDDDDWRITALRCMFHHDGFEGEILESLPNENLDVRAEAIRAAGSGGLQEAWPYIRTVLIEAASAYKPLLLAAIDSIGHVRPEDAQGLLEHLVSSDDQDIARAAEKALAFVLWPLANYDFGDGAQRH